MQEFFIQLDSQTCLHCCAWLPEAPPIAVVQIIHGVAEYIARYDAFASYLAGQGFLVVGEDHPGHGKSVGEKDQKGYLTGGWMNVVKGIHLLYCKTHSENPSLPYFMLGHSMGSFLLRTYLFTYHTALCGALISGTGWQNSAMLQAGRMICREEASRLGEHNTSNLIQTLIFGSYNRKFSPNRTPYDWVCSNEAVVDAYAKDPDCTFIPTIQLCREMLDGIHLIQQKENLSRMQKEMPVFFFAGEQDPVGNMGKGVLRSANAFRSAGMRDVTLKLYPNMRHETLNETGKEQVYADVRSWMQDKSHFCNHK